MKEKESKALVRFLYQCLRGQCFLDPYRGTQSIRDLIVKDDIFVLYSQLDCLMTFGYMVILLKENEIGREQSNGNKEANISAEIAEKNH